MYKVIQKILCLVMSLVVLCSTFSFTFYKHYCSNILVKTSITNENSCCDSDNKLATKISSEKSECCSDEKFAIVGQDELQFKFEDISLENQQFLVSYFSSFIALFEHENYQVSTFKNYKPPLVFQPIFKLDEAYLI